MTTALHLTVGGRVQGVGFRAWTVREAAGLGLDGWVRNRRDGTVEILAAGDPTAVRALVERCHSGPPLARVDSVVEAPGSPEGIGPGFVQADTV